MFLNFQSNYGSTTFPVVFLVSGIAVCDGVGIKKMGRKIRLTNDGFLTKYSLDKSSMVQKEDLNDVSVTEKDYVFLLSNAEYNSYKNTIATAGNSAGWWLRTPQSDDKVLVVQTNGNAVAEYAKISPYTGGIRPAFCYKLN